MPCYHPIKAYPYGITKNGKQALCFKPPSPGHKSIKVPCGQCIGCRLERSRQWALRMTHEASLYDENSFITLTYDDENRPEDYSLNKEHFKKFMKRLRQAAKRKYGKEKIRYFHCGEYGEESYRDTTMRFFSISISGIKPIIKLIMIMTYILLIFLTAYGHLDMRSLGSFLSKLPLMSPGT